MPAPSQVPQALSESKKKSLERLSSLSEEALAFLAELSERPGVEKKLLGNKFMIKSFL